jgi:hypothetical protein
MMPPGGPLETSNRLWSAFKKQDMQYAYNVTLRRFLATIVAVENQWVLYIVSVYECVCV